MCPSQLGKACLCRFVHSKTVSDRKRERILKADLYRLFTFTSQGIYPTGQAKCLQFSMEIISLRDLVHRVMKERRGDRRVGGKSVAELLRLARLFS